MEMKEYVIDCRRLTDAAAAHAYLKELFAFPEYYGANLDALYDCLSSMPPCRVRMDYPWALSQLGAWAAPLLEVFCDVADECEGFVLA
ncbi:MAG: barnase inhibitor [Ruminococcaceae bacterium]|nr:barnase inhibitor [Oscillospiraceae bacterium]